MKTVIFINEDIQDLKKEYQDMFTPFLEQKFIFCCWNEKSIPTSVIDYVLDEKWRAIVLSKVIIDKNNYDNEAKRMKEILNILKNSYLDTEYEFANCGMHRKVTIKKSNSTKRQSIYLRNLMEIIFIVPENYLKYYSLELGKNFVDDYKFIFYSFKNSRNLNNKQNWFGFFSLVLLVSIQLIDSRYLQNNKIYFAKIKFDKDIIIQNISKHLQKLEKKAKEINKQIEKMINIKPVSIRQDILNERVDNDIPSTTLSQPKIFFGKTPLDDVFLYLKINVWEWSRQVERLKFEIVNLYIEKEPYLKKSNQKVRKRLKELKYNYLLNENDQDKLIEETDQILRSMYPANTIRCIPIEEMLYLVDKEKIENNRVFKAKISGKCFFIVSFIYLIIIFFSIAKIVIEATFFINATLNIILFLILILISNISVLLFILIRNYCLIKYRMYQFRKFVQKVAKAFAEEFKNYTQFQSKLLNYNKGKKVIEYNVSEEIKNNYKKKLPIFQEKESLDEHIELYCSIIKYLENESSETLNKEVSLENKYPLSIKQFYDCKKIYLNEEKIIFSPYSFIDGLALNEIGEDEENDRIII